MFDFKEWSRIYVGAAFGATSQLLFADPATVRVNWTCADNNSGNVKNASIVLEFDAALMAQLKVSKRQAEIGEKLISWLTGWLHRSGANDCGDMPPKLRIDNDIAQLRLAPLPDSVAKESPRRQASI